MEELFIITAVAGATEFIKRVFDRDYRAACIIAASGLIGLLAGVLAVAGATPITGLIIGLGASGIVTIASKVQGKS